MEGHVLSKIKTFSCCALEGFIFDKTFLLGLYLLHKGSVTDVGVLWFVNVCTKRTTMVLAYYMQQL